MFSPVSAVPTNVITGFLGVGKTTAIQHLLATKGGDAPWAVLVNEFGEVGIDGNLLAGKKRTGQVHIKEVPGGCMCCAAGIPMQVALNQLLREARPERLLIEPTGLGHPREILAVLQAGAYASVLDLRTTITLVDARKVNDPRYTGNDTFNQQLAVADLVVANKSDLYQSGDLEQLQNYLQKINQPAPLEQVVHGQLQNQWLDRPRLQASSRSGVLTPQQLHTGPSVAPDLALPESGLLRVDNQGEGYYSVGWRFHPERVFNYGALLEWLRAYPQVRLKAVCITGDGVYGLNVADGMLTIMDLDDAVESRLEIISEQPLDGPALEQQLLSCFYSSSS